MGYFDALTSGYFKTAPDGRKLFFPWGVLGRGYTIDSEQDYERLRRQVKAYTIVSLVLIVAVTALQAYVGAVVIGTLLIAFYLGDALSAAWPAGVGRTTVAAGQHDLAGARSQRAGEKAPPERGGAKWRHASWRAYRSSPRAFLSERPRSRNAPRPVSPSLKRGASGLVSMSEIRPNPQEKAPPGSGAKLGPSCMGLPVRRQTHD